VTRKAEFVAAAGVGSDAAQQPPPAPAASRRTHVLLHDAAAVDVAAVDVAPEVPRSAWRALRDGGVRGVLRHAFGLPPPAACASALLLGRPPPYATAVVAGTWDRLHAGHRLMLTCAALACNGTLYLGVTGEALTRSKRLRALLQPYAARQAAAVAFVRGVRPRLAVRSGELTDAMRGIEARRNRPRAHASMRGGD
jgi:hypothetical protein